MSEYNAKNYTEQGGEKTVIGGTLEIREGAWICQQNETPKFRNSGIGHCMTPSA